MSDDQFFDGGWCWMSHPDWNNSNAIPVFMSEADGTRFYVPLDPSNATDFEWDERDAEWQMVQPPMADLERAVELDDLRASHQRLKEALGAVLCMLPSDHEDRPAEERIPASYCYVRWHEIREARAALKDAP